MLGTTTNQTNRNNCTLKPRLFAYASSFLQLEEKRGQNSCNASMEETEPETETEKKRVSRVLFKWMYKLEIN